MGERRNALFNKIISKHAFDYSMNITCMFVLPVSSEVETDRLLLMMKWSEASMIS